VIGDARAGLAWYILPKYNSGSPGCCLLIKLYWSDTQESYVDQARVDTPFALHPIAIRGIGDSEFV